MVRPHVMSCLGRRASAIRPVIRLLRTVLVAARGSGSQLRSALWVSGVRANARERRIGPRYKFYYMSDRTSRSGQQPAGWKGNRRKKSTDAPGSKTRKRGASDSDACPSTGKHDDEPSAAHISFQKFRHHGVSGARRYISEKTVTMYTFLYTSDRCT